MMDNIVEELARNVEELKGRLLAANREIHRMHQQVLLAKAAAKEATSEVSSTCHAVYIGAALKLGGPACLPRHVRWSCRISTSLLRRSTRSPSTGTIRFGPWWSGWRRREHGETDKTD